MQELQALLSEKDKEIHAPDFSGEVYILDIDGVAALGQGDQISQILGVDGTQTGPGIVVEEGAVPNLRSLLDNI